MKGKRFCRRCGWFVPGAEKKPAGAVGASLWSAWCQRLRRMASRVRFGSLRERSASSRKPQVALSRLILIGAAAGFIAPLLLLESERGSASPWTANRLARLAGLDRGAVPPSPRAMALRCATPSCGAEFGPLAAGSKPCPQCGTPRPLLLVSEEGWLEPATDLLRGYVPPGAAALARGRSADQAAVVLWFQTYRRLKEAEPAPRLRLPETTWRQRGGDAAAHALFLADLLASQGYRARVVLGRRRDRSHAWVVIEHEGREYLLDLLGGRPARFPPRADLLAAEYRAELAFDRDSSYFPAVPGTVPGRYFDDTLWTPAAIPPRG